ncbi:MAG: hypothetical protein KGM97_09770 [Alphaproteobacteria bacterium]|nr:hypothetical protein [Alphaproteobacteria bacterium]MDE2631262.1 hypothetical protein [Alphaproteobacteria bacterium]
MGKAAFAALSLFVLAGCASHRAQQGGNDARCEAEWHPAVAMLLRYADKDGNVSRAAMEAGLKKDFDAADANHDGVLEPDEVRAVNEKRWQEDQAAASPLVDWKDAGYVDFDDFAVTARSLFDQMDTAGKGMLTAKQLRPQQCGKGDKGEGEQNDHHGGGRGRPRGGQGGDEGGGGGDGDDGGYPGQ